MKFRKFHSPELDRSVYTLGWYFRQLEAIRKMNGGDMNYRNWYKGYFAIHSGKLRLGRRSSIKEVFRG